MNKPTIQKTVIVTEQGVKFGNAWFSHEHITGYTAEQLNSGNCRITGKAYMDWLATEPVLTSAVPPISLNSENEYDAREGAAVQLSAVAVVDESDDGKRLDWLLEGGIAELEKGQVLIVADRDVTDSYGHGELYSSPHALLLPEKFTPNYFAESGEFAAAFAVIANVIIDKILSMNSHLSVSRLNLEFEIEDRVDCGSCRNITDGCKGKCERTEEWSKP